MNKPTEVAALEEIKNYLLNQNRPYSVNDVFENLHKAHGKTDQFPTCSEEELLGLDAEIKERDAEMKQLQSAIKQLESELKLATNSLTTEEIVDKIDSIATDIEESKDKLEKLRESAKIISLEEKDEICKRYDNNVKHWRSRKRLASSILDSILESWPKKKKDLLEEIGIETDEDFKVECP